MQGDPWDAQGDMFMALCGGVCAVVLLRVVHGRAMAAAPEAPAS